MATDVHAIACAALAGVLTVPSVPGFAQTNSASSANALTSSTTAARVYVATRSDYANVEPAANVTVTSLYDTVIAQMLERSPTFRRQSARIAGATNLSITLRTEPRSGHRADAWTTMARNVDGRRQVDIAVVVGARTIELIAHEFEHVIEQLDGVDLRHKAALRASGVRACDCGHIEMFETDRAIAVGQRVAREVSEGGRGQ